MLALMAAPNQFGVPLQLVRGLNFPAVRSVVALVGPERRRRGRRRVRLEALCSVVAEAKVSSYFGFLERRSRRRRLESYWWCSCCKFGGSEEGDLELEAEILKFMNKSEKPGFFPTKSELVDAGRIDLVEAIVEKGGWLSLGWDLDNDSDEENIQERVKIRGSPEASGHVDDDIGEFQQRVDSRDGNYFDEAEVGPSDSSSVPSNCFQSTSTSGRSLEMGEEDTGIEGILSRLEKQRNFSFGINLGKNGHESHISSKNGGDDLRFGASKDGNTKLSHEGNFSANDGSGNSIRPETWRTWSIQRAGFSDKDFEAAEISFNKSQVEGEKNTLKDEILGITGSPMEDLDRQKEINQNPIGIRLQQLELELASTLCLLRSKNEEFISMKGHENSNDLQKLSDAWEFQENEIMNTRDRLRSLRAKLAVLEGKVALTIIDARKIVEEKQKRIDITHTALQLLRTACIVWPNSGSEVLLSGSFDGWTSQRKMKKSATGIFSLSLKLYPGRYEIKFIVDGIWRTDPLRPVVRDNGYENNLLIIH